MNTHYSAFSLFRSYQQDTENSGLEVWDIKNDCVNVISYENFSEVIRVKNLLNSIQLSIKNSSEKQEINHGYRSWLKMGWHKSVDYYVASRATGDKNLFPLKNKNIVLKKHQQGMLPLMLEKNMMLSKHYYVGVLKGSFMGNDVSLPRFFLMVYSMLLYCPIMN